MQIEEKERPTKYLLGTRLPPRRQLLYLPIKGMDLMHGGYSLICRFSINITMMVFSTEYLPFPGNSSSKILPFSDRNYPNKAGVGEGKVPRNKHGMNSEFCRIVGHSQGSLLLS